MKDEKGAVQAAGLSLAHAAEELVRAGGSSLQWEGASLSTHFQPIYSVHRGFSLGFEALVRAHDVFGRAVYVEELFAAAGEARRSLLDWACRALHLRSYASVDPGDRMLFLNVHPEAAIRDFGRAREFAELIRYYGLTPKRVCVEILEAPCSSEDRLQAAVDSYRDLGLSIAMDDFGAGSSNLARVHRLRPDVVKIDRSMLAGAVGDDAAGRMLPGMVELLHDSQAKVAIEGIETREEALVAIESGADYLQGFFLAAPDARLNDVIHGTATLDRLLHHPPGRSGPTRELAALR